MEQIQFFDNKFQEIISSELQFLQLTTKEIQGSEIKDEPLVSSTINILTCSYCRVEFTNSVDQREHYKLDWHRYNIKQSLLARSPVTEDEFTEKADDVSSISGSDTEDEAENLENIASSQCKIFIKNNEGRVFSIYRCLLFEKKAELEATVIRKILKNYSVNLKWTILMLGGGHFAGAIYNGNEQILHKTFHSYTVRAGQGGGQSSKDNRGGCCKSGGSSLRRYNEQTYIQHISTLIESWKEEISKCSLIIYRAAGNFNRNVLFGGKTPPLDRFDSRLRAVPFSTRRPTLTELKRTFSCLSTIQLYDSLEVAVQLLQKTNVVNNSKRSKSSNIHRSKSREILPHPLPDLVPSNDSSSSSENDNQSNKNELFINSQEISFQNDLQEYGDSLTPQEKKRSRRRAKPTRPSKPKPKEPPIANKKEMKEKNDIFQAVQEGDLIALELLLEKLRKKLNNTVNDDNVEEPSKTTVDVINQLLDENSNTLLHAAVIHQQLHVIDYFLKHDADLCKKNNKQQTPYTCTQNKEIREIFKEFAKAFPEKYNYNKAQIPTTTLSPEELLEKKKLQKKVKREKEKEKKKVNEIKVKEKEEQQRYLNLSDREKRALAAERRIINQSGTVTSRCFLCALDISGQVPFEYSGNRFCSMECLKAHRIATPSALS